jgi:hypothetical protein
MRRRDVIAAISGAAIARPVLAADPTKTVHIGVLAPAPLRPIDSLKQRLHDRGWIEGQNVQFEFRWAGSDDKRYQALAAELVALPRSMRSSPGARQRYSARNGPPRQSRSSWPRSPIRSGSARSATCRARAAM